MNEQIRQAAALAGYLSKEAAEPLTQTLGEKKFLTGFTDSARVDVNSPPHYRNFQQLLRRPFHFPSTGSKFPVRAQAEAMRRQPFLRAVTQAVLQQHPELLDNAGDVGDVGAAAALSARPSYADRPLEDWEMKKQGFRTERQMQKHLLQQGYKPQRRNSAASENKLDLPPQQKAFPWVPTPEA